MLLIANTRHNGSSLLLLIGLVALSCQNPKADTLFKDLTSEETGITFVNELTYSDSI